MIKMNFPMKFTTKMSKNSLFTLENGGIICSVSVILFDPIKGYLLCTENRKGFPDKTKKFLASHILGGKVEKTDNSPLETGIREFCEELQYCYDDKTISETTEILIDAFDDVTMRYKDFLVSKNKNLYNRFYVINIEEIEDDPVKDSLYDTITNWKTNDNNDIKSIFYWKNDDVLKIKSTSLLDMFIKNKPNYHLNSNNDMSGTISIGGVIFDVEDYREFENDNIQFSNVNGVLVKKYITKSHTIIIDDVTYNVEDYREFETDNIDFSNVNGYINKTGTISINNVIVNDDIADKIRECISNNIKRDTEEKIKNDKFIKMNITDTVNLKMLNIFEKFNKAH